MPQFSKYSIGLILLALLFFVPFLGGVHLFDWDEINFAEIAREMIATGDYMRPQINYAPFWEKPPLFIWMQVLTMKLFGANEFAARLPNAIAGIITLLVLFKIGKLLKDVQFGLIWALCYFGSVLPFLYFKSGIIDPWFNLFIFLGLYFFIKYYWTKAYPVEKSKGEYWNLIAGGIFIGLGMLTKGPVALLLSGLTIAIYFIIKKFQFKIRILDIILFGLISLGVIFLWLGIETINNGTWFINEFVVYQWRLFSTPDAGHAGFPAYHFVVLLIGVFPASIFAIRSFFKMESSRDKNEREKDFSLWMKVLFWVVLLLFSIVKSKIVHYSSLCYFPLTFLASVVIYELIRKRIAFKFWMKFGLVLIASVFILATVLVPILGQNLDFIKPLFEKDPFAVANLNAEVNWTYWAMLPGFWLLGLLLFFFVSIRREKLDLAFKSLFIGTGLFVMLTLIFDINNIEAISQRAAIEFYESKQSEDCIIITHGFKSYAHLFYAKKRPFQNKNLSNKSFLLSENQISKPVYVVTKINKAESLRQQSNLAELYEKNGFVFFKKK